MEYIEERRARDDYYCDGCRSWIKAGTQYICVTYHEAKQVPVHNSKRLYHGKQYYRTVHTNVVKRYHIGCKL